jgi:putative addiction module killer protein/probable addiction module antidote protein
MKTVVEIRHYLTRAGRDVFDGWLSQLADAPAQARIVTRVNRLALGNFGDCKRLRQGLCELGIDWRPGYRVYYAMLGRLCVLLLCGGDKRKQSSDIDRAGISEGLSRKDSNLMKRKANISHDEAIVRRLRKHPDFAAEYLKSALEEDDDPRVLLIALRHLALAQGIAKVAKAARIERESLYRALSARGNPRLSTLFAVSKAIGLRLTVKAA